MTGPVAADRHGYAPLASLWTWGRALRLLDGPDEVRLRTVAPSELGRAKERGADLARWLITPEQMTAPVRIR